MSEPPSGAERAGRRAARNTGVTAAGEIVGKLSTLVLLAVLAREVGAADFGVLVFALAFLGITLIPVGFGTDPYLLRQVAKDRRRQDVPGRRALDELFWSVLSLKLAVTVPMLLISAVCLELLGTPPRTQLVTAVLAVGLLIDQFARTFQTLFLAYQRSEFVAIGIVVQRLLTLATGVAVMFAGGGLLEVAAVLGVGSLVNLAITFGFLRRLVPLPRIARARTRWRALTSASFPFAVQDVFTVLLFKLDAVLLSILATDVAVGRYGGAYRLLEATLFVGYAVSNSVVAMYSYLTRDSDPTVGAVFGRSIKLVLVVLVPVGVILGLLAEPVVTLVFGPGLSGAGSSLRLLAPVVVAIALVTLSTALINSQHGTGLMVRIAAAVLAGNVGLNLLLIPIMAEEGAALAMLLTEVTFAVICLSVAVRVVGGLAWDVVLAGPVLGGVVMALVITALANAPLLAAIAGGIAYLAVLLGWERVRSPADLDFVLRLVRRRELAARNPV